MAQPSVSSFFISRKRGVDEDIVASKKKVICLERNSEILKEDGDFSKEIVFSSDLTQGQSSSGNEEEKKKKTIVPLAAVRQGITPQRKRSSRIQNKTETAQVPKIANFWLGGSLSPQKKSKPESTNELGTEANAKMRTPTKAPSSSASKQDCIEKTILISKNALNTEELKKKLKSSSRLAELQTRLNKLQNKFEKYDKSVEKNSTSTAQKTTDKSEEAKTLKPFKNIELEILSPKKRLPSSPLKLKDSPMKNSLLGSPKVLSPKKLFSPSKSLVKGPACERFRFLIEKDSPTLQLPFKYRCLLEIFKAVDQVSSMFFNRKEKITFKKLKPAVQRLLRKNIYESHLAQINHMMPNAYKFAQEKTRNFGSTSKQDYYQLVITPSIQSDNTDVGQLTLSPQLLIERSKEMQKLLTDLVFKEHEKFLQTLDIPMNVTRGALKRWHPEFPLESVPDVEQSALPQPPNVEKFTTAKDVLSTARNLFNCSTPMERALERLEAKKKEEKAKQIQNQQLHEDISYATPARGKEDTKHEKTKNQTTDASSSLLKGVPQALLEKIRAKQAAKALDTMTRRPSQERDAAKYARLPEVARHVRNVFITEKKSVLALDIVLNKIQNSYKACSSLKELEELLRLIATELPAWLSFHEIRNSMFVRISSEFPLNRLVEKLQGLAAQKANIK